VIWGRTSLRIVSFVEGLLLLVDSPGCQSLLRETLGELAYQRNGLFKDDTDVAGSRIRKWV